MIYDSGTDEKVITDYDRKMEQSYDTFFIDLERLYPKADRTNNALFDAVVRFACIHDDTYFETGVLTGFRLYKEMDIGYKSHAKMDLLHILNNQTHIPNKTCEENSVLKELCMCRMESELEERIRQDKKYQKKDKKTRKEIMKVEKIALN